MPSSRTKLSSSVRVGGIDRGGRPSVEADTLGIAMGNLDGLRAHLKQWKAAAEADAADGAALERQRAEWIADVTALMDRLHAWLREPEREGLLIIRREGTSVTESKYGTYDVPAMIIQAPGPHSVHVHPVGLDVIGSAGRVDLDSGPRKARLLRQQNGEWKVALPSRVSRAILDLDDLSEETFISALEHLLVSTQPPFAE